MEILTLDLLNAAPDAERFGALLDGIYEHSPWVGQAAFDARPFRSLAQLKWALSAAVRAASPERQLALVRAHPELAGRAAMEGTLTDDSTREQDRAGLKHCSPEELASLVRLNAEYTARFGWPFVLAVRGPGGGALDRAAIIATLARRLKAAPDLEFRQCLGEIDRIAELRLNDRFGIAPHAGQQVWQWAVELAVLTEVPGELTVTYATPTHRAVAERLVGWMKQAGFDDAGIDEIGNVIGRYRADSAAASPKLLITGSHFDTVRNGGKYDGRLGILAPMAAVAHLRRANHRLPFDLEVVGFADEEGVRYSSTFLGSSALIGAFDKDLLAKEDADGVTMRSAMRSAGLDPDAIDRVARDPRRMLGFIEIHIEQGPVLLERDLPLGVVTSINGVVRLQVEIEGLAGHAGTTPMPGRRDAFCAAAEIALYIERRCGAEADLVGTVGRCEIYSGSINVVPGHCRFTLDLRAPNDDKRDLALADIRAEMVAICSRRGVELQQTETLRASAAPCSDALKAYWKRAVERLGVPVFELPSGAGHDAMKMAQAVPQAMLFVRCGNGGISHNPLETMTSDDADLAVAAFIDVLQQIASDS